MIKKIRNDDNKRLSKIDSQKKKNKINMKNGFLPKKEFHFLKW